MMEFTLGSVFWRERRAELEEARKRKSGESDEFRLKEAVRTKRRKRGIVKKKMGFFQVRYINISSHLFRKNA